MKTVFKILILVFFLIIITGLIIVQWLNNGLKKHIESNELQKIVETINETESLPKRFYLIHDSVFPNVRSRGTYIALLNQIREESHKYEIENNPGSISIYGKTSPTLWTYKALVDNNIIRPLTST
ncbi:MAG: hypothetical protein ACWA6U_16310 [Breznakibacter sp.]